MQTIYDFLTALTMVIGIISIVFILAKYNFLVKKAMYENNATPPDPSVRLTAIDFGFVLVGIGFGLGVATLFILFELKPIVEELVLYIFPLVFGGLSLVVSYLFKKKLAK